MYSLLVLGLIPGTNIQIGFWAWVGLMICLLIIVKLYWRRARSLATSFFQDKWQSLYDEDGLHDPWHASRYHRRLDLKAR